MKQTHTRHADGKRIRLIGTKQCPFCREVKSLADFGFRKMTKKNEYRPQSWCKKCRA